MIVSSSQSMRFARISVSAWGLLQTLLCLLLLAPPLAILVVAFAPSDPIAGHLIETVLGRYMVNTFALMALVGLLALLFGVSSAWAVSRYQFKGRIILSWYYRRLFRLISLLTLIQIFWNIQVHYKQLIVKLLVLNLHVIIHFLKFAHLQVPVLLWRLFYILISILWRAQPFI